MKKVYESPLMVAEEFVAAQNVASGCTRVSNTVETTSWEPQTVECIVSTQDNIFGSTNCASLSGYTVINSSALVRYDYDADGVIEDNEYYFVWKSDQMDGRPTSAQKTHLDNLAALAGSSISGSGNVIHAGPVDLTKISKTEYSFSY